MSSLDETVCCYEGDAFTPNTTLLTTTADDGCTTAYIECRKDGHRAEMVFKVQNDCG